MVTVELAAANMEIIIKNPEMFSARRKLKMGTFVGFEAPESEGIKTRDGHVLAGVQIMIIGIHLTALSKDDAARLLAVADIVTACASKHIRELAKPLVQVGTAVPLFGLTSWGKELLVERAKKVEQSLLINTMPLPVLPEKKQPRPLV